MEHVKSPLKSVGIMGPVVTLGVWLVAQFTGLEVTESEVAGVFDAICLIVASLTGIYGRWRATTRVSLKK